MLICSYVCVRLCILHCYIVVSQQFKFGVPVVCLSVRMYASGCAFYIVTFLFLSSLNLVFLWYVYLFVCMREVVHFTLLHCCFSAV
jgi:hypothetical protein